MDQRLEVIIQDPAKDIQAEQLVERIKKGLKLQLACRSVHAYNIVEKLSEQEMVAIASSITDSNLHKYSIGEPFFKDSWRIEIGMLPGITDIIGSKASEEIKTKIGKRVDIHHSIVYAIGGSVDEYLCGQIANMLYNPAIHRCIIYRPGQEVTPNLPLVKIQKEPSILKISLHIGEDRFNALAAERILSLSYDEFEAIKHYFKLEKTLAARKKVGLDNKITDVEFELLAHIWGGDRERVFDAKISYEENGEVHAIDSLSKTFLYSISDQVKKPYIIGHQDRTIVKFNHEYDIVAAIVHNQVKADPQTNAMTNCLKIERELASAGATVLGDFAVLCFGHVDIKEKDVPKGAFHPSTIANVINGIKHGKDMNYSVVFDKGYLAKPFFYCGGVGFMPSQIHGRRPFERIVELDYLAVMVGTRIGKDGVHEILSSLDMDAPRNIASICDPIAHKRLVGFVNDARDKALYDAAAVGSIGSSMMELAQISNGCEVYLDKCPLKYSGLDPWEIMISESQDRMMLAIRPDKSEALTALAKLYDIELAVVGKFTNSKRFHAVYKNETVAYVDLAFLQNGVPQLKLTASWKKLIFHDPNIGEFRPSDALQKLLSRNVTEKSIIEPNGWIVRPSQNSDEGMIISTGICQRYVQDEYSMAAMAFDIAVRKALATGAKFGYLAGLANFSWPDPLKSNKTVDGEQKLGGLVRSCIAIYDCATSYGVPIIASRSNLKNDHYAGGIKYSIPPTILVTIMGKSTKKIGPEFKNPGDLIYVLGTTRNELGGSEFYRLFGGVGNDHPQIYPDEHLPLYKAISAAIEEGLVLSAHTVSDGGLAVAFAKCALGNSFGAELDLDRISKTTEDQTTLMFSESAGRLIVSVKLEDAEKFENIMKGTNCVKAGRVRGDKRFLIKCDQDSVINESIEDIKTSYLKGVKIAQ